MMRLLSAMETPSSPLLRSSRSADALAGTLFNLETEQGFFFRFAGELLLSCGVAAFGISGALDLESWSKVE